MQVDELFSHFATGSEDTDDHARIINTRHATRLVRQEGLD
jgi:hypothetical protein